MTDALTDERGHMQAELAQLRAEIHRLGNMVVHPDMVQMLHDEVERWKGRALRAEAALARQDPERAAVPA